MTCIAGSDHTAFADVWRRQTRAELAFALTTATLALLVACVVLEVWNDDLRLPFDYSRDAALTAPSRSMWSRMGRCGGNNELGPPRGQELYDLPSSPR